MRQQRHSLRGDFILPGNRGRPSQAAEPPRGCFIRKHFVAARFSFLGRCAGPGIGGVAGARRGAFPGGPGCLLSSSPDSPGCDRHCRGARRHQGLLHGENAQFRSVLWLPILGHPEKIFVKHFEKGNEVFLLPKMSSQLFFLKKTKNQCS